VQVAAQGSPPSAQGCMPAAPPGSRALDTKLPAARSNWRQLAERACTLDVRWTTTRAAGAYAEAWVSVSIIEN